MKKNLLITLIITISFLDSRANSIIVNTLSGLTSAYANAYPGDTVIIANGTYNWGEISISNNHGNINSNWIVVTSQSLGAVIFSGTTYLKFDGTRILINGFKFINGDAGTNPIISFRTSSTNFANYSRISNMIFDNYNTPSPDGNIQNEWVGIYGIRNRVDHCDFINKSNAKATIVIWYSTATFPDKSISTYHNIDSNYFAGRSYMGGNGGETIRVGVGNNSRTDGFNIIEYNLFEGCIQTEPEIVSNKSCHNIYRYNTFKNCNGGLTLRMGKYCEVYGNYFINDDPTKTDSYGIRIIDKGHKVFNNYLEGLLGSESSSTTMRTPIVIYNGTFASSDSLNPLILNGEYLPADSTIVAFNSIVNCKGYGIKIGYNDNGNAIFQPLGIQISNNAINMATGKAAYLESTNTSLTYFSEGNKYNAPNGLGLSNSSGFIQDNLLYGNRSNGILTAPSSLLDAAVNTDYYSMMLRNIDLQKQTRSTIYDVGSDEINGVGNIITHPLDSSIVGAGTTINNNVIINPVFIQISPICKGDSILLPSTSINGVNGIWTPTAVNNQTTTYTFTPVAGSNANTTTMIVMMLQPSENNISVITASSYNWHGETYSTSGNYSWIGVNSVGCDSIVNLHLIIDDISNSDTAIIYSNPSPNGIIKINLNKFHISNVREKEIQLSIFDVNGRLCLSKKVLEKNSELNVNQLSKGVYFIRIMSKDLSILYHTKLLR